MGFNSSDTLETLPASVTLTNGVGTFSATLNLAGNQTITATDTNNGNVFGTSRIIFVGAAQPTHFAIIGAPASITAGVQFGVTVVAQDQFNNTASTYTGTAHFTSSDHQALLPANAPLANGVGIFAVTLNTAGVQTITITDTVNTNLTSTSSPISINANGAANFVVTSLTPTSTGFVATFNEPFNPGSVNLYDTAGAIGAADVTLTSFGGPQISYRGSLIIDPTDSTITFVKTSNFTGVNFNPSTGVLSAGTYTVTFRSASNGFTDLSGNLLDSGSNYVATFVVTAPPVVVGIPSFARGPTGSDFNVPNTAIFGIPLDLSSGSGVTSGQFTLQYNSALLNITAAGLPSLLNTTLSLDASSSPGQAVIDFSSTTALTQTGVVRLGGLTATVPKTAVYASTALLHFSGVTFNGGAIAAIGDDAVQVVDDFGDTNGDGTLSAGDAAQISRVATGIDTNATAGTLGGFSGFPLIDPMIIADLNNDGQVDAPDVTLMSSYLSGTPRGQIPTPPTTTPVLPTGASVQLSIPTNLTASPGGTVVVPVNINNPDPAGSGGLAGIALAIDFDPSVLTVASNGITPGTLTSNLVVTANVGNGELGIVLSSATPITSTTGGSIVLITFTVNAGAVLRHDGDQPGSHQCAIRLHGHDPAGFLDRPNPTVAITDQCRQ